MRPIRLAAILVAAAFATTGVTVVSTTSASATSAAPPVVTPTPAPTSAPAPAAAAARPHPKPHAKDRTKPRPKPHPKPHPKARKKTNPNAMTNGARNCVFAATHATRVRSAPLTTARKVDRIRRRDRTVGDCSTYVGEQWRRVVGTRQLKVGYTPARHLRTLGTAKQFGL